METQQTQRIPVLDHGYVEFVEAWGHGKDGERGNVDPDLFPADFEVGIIEAARQSTQGSFRGWEGTACTCSYFEVKPHLLPGVELRHTTGCNYQPGDVKLLKYLHNHGHSTPFEFAGMTIEVQAPIFVFREWHRHRTQSYNEASARYEPLPDLYYVPSIDRCLPQFQDSNKNKQAQAMPGKVADAENAKVFILGLKAAYRQAEGIYQNYLVQGIPKELARLVMPVGHYSRMRASANLRNWLAFLTLRCDPSAQWEIRQFAWAVAKIIEQKFPRTFKLWDDQREGIA